jgi:hypothetical protein
MLTATKYVEHYSVSTARGTVRLSYYPAASGHKAHWTASQRSGDTYISITDDAATKAGALVRIGQWAQRGEM